MSIDPQTRHELLNALNQIIGYAEMLADDAGSEGRQKACEDLGIIRCAAQGITQRLAEVFYGSPVNERACAEFAPMHTCPVEPVIPIGTNEKPKNEHILIVDDNGHNRMLLSRLLESQGYRAQTAENGVGALKILGETAFDLILLDVLMPEMDGITLLTRLKSDPSLRKIPVIMISACTEMCQVIKGIELGAEDYLPKPFNATLLKARIGASLEKKRLRDQEMRLIGQALQAEAALDRHRALTQAVAGIAHEINTPLGIVRTALSVIESRLGQTGITALFNAFPEHRDALQDIREASSLMVKHVESTHRLIERFKNIAADQMDERQETVDLPETVRDAVELFRLNARQAGIEIAIDASGIEIGADWRGYPGYLRQILLNFLQNIERYAYPDGRGGKVDITLADGIDDELGLPVFVLRIRDYGLGIEERIVAKIFDPFFTTGRARGGSGLGLAIVKNMVTLAMRGRISVASTPGRGTCFTMILPKQ